MKSAIKHLLKQLPGAIRVKAYLESREEKQFLNAIDAGATPQKHNIVVNPANSLHNNYAEELDYFYRMSGRFNRIIIWGFKEHFHTHRFIHKHFYDNLVKLGARALWLEDQAENSLQVEKNDLIFAMNQAYTHLPMRQDVFYCLHNLEELKEKKLQAVYLQVYSNQIKSFTHQWNDSTFFDKNNQMLYQAWGTDLLPHEFYEPVFNPQATAVCWVGSIWNNNLNQGNEREIEELKAAIKPYHLEWQHLEKISINQNIEAVRQSRFAPAISGAFQVQVDYLPCRVFKNVSYGSLAISNVKKFDELFGEHHIKSNTLSDLVHKVMDLNEKEWKQTSIEQQKIVAERHTYLHKFNRIFKALAELY